MPLHFEGIKQDLLGNRVPDIPIYVDRDLTRSHQLIQKRVVSNSFVFTRLALMGDGGKKVFVTVGTTSFDDLIRAIDTPECKAAILRRGYSSLLIQMGRGSYIPSQSSKNESGLEVNFFTFAPNLRDYMSSASLIISHAGSGSIFEALRMGKPLVVVVNEALMDNHQVELAEELAEQKYLYYASPKTLVETINNMNLDVLVPYKALNPSPVVKSLNKFLGFHDI